VSVVLAFSGLIAFFVATYLLGGFKSNGEPYPLVTTTIFVLIGGTFFAIFGWIMASFELRALNPLTGRIQYWREPGAGSSALFGMLFCLAMSRNGGIKDIEISPFMMLLVGRLLLVATWWVLRIGVATAIVWLAITGAVSVVSLSFNRLPAQVSDNPVLSFVMSSCALILGAWAFWAMMEADRNGTFARGYLPQRSP